MPLSPADDFMLHQTPHTFDEVATSDRNFYDRHYFNMHASSDELFVITGMGQYPNLGVTDAFITVSIGTKQFTVRASRELGHDRLDSSVGPFRIEVLEGLRQLHITCDPNEWGLHADLTFTGTVDALEEPRTFIRSYGRVQQDVSRYAQVGVWEGELTVDGRTFAVTPDLWKGARDRSWGVRPVGEPEHPGIKARQVERRPRLPPRLDPDAVRRPHDQGPDRRGRRREPPRRGVDAGVEQRPGTTGRPPRPAPRSTRPTSRAPGRSSTRPSRSARTTPTPSSCTPPRCGRCTWRPAPGYVPDDEWGHGYYQGPLKVQGVEHDLSDPEVRRRYVRLNETLSRFETASGEVGYGLHENMLLGCYRPGGFDTPDAVAP